MALLIVYNAPLRRVWTAFNLSCFLFADAHAQDC